jgi:hypothetical protein
MLLVLPVLVVLMALQEHLVIMVLMALQEHQVNQEQVELQEQVVHPVLTEHLVLKVIKVILI